jgi:electron transfer flavoprotein alpha subunit
MATILVVGELGPDGALTKLSTEIATAARSLGDARGLVPGATADAAAQELAAFLPSVEIERGVAADASASEIAAVAATALDGVDVVVLPASPSGRDLAGVLSALTGLGVLANAVGVAAGDDGPVTTHSVFGGKLITDGGFAGGRGIITVRPNTVTAEPLATPGTVGERTSSPVRDIPPVRVVEHVAAEGAAVSIDDARIIVSGGRGVGGPEGFALVQELAELLGGAVGASRAAVDSGWIPYSQQIGQTGKIVKPQLYLALGISGAIQHKVGMQTAGAIVAVNRDPDAPIADFADVVVVGDLFEVGRALADQLRARSG